MPSIVVWDVPHHHGGFSSARRPGNRKRCRSGCGLGCSRTLGSYVMHLSPFDVHRFTLTLKGTHIYHISHVKFKKQDTSSPKVATFCKRLDFCFQEWYSTLSSGKCYINPLHTVWDSHPSRNSNINVQSPCISVVFSYGFLATELGSFCRFVVRLKRIRVFRCSHPSKPPKPSLASVPSSGSGSSFATSWRNVINSL